MNMEKKVNVIVRMPVALYNNLVVEARKSGYSSVQELIREVLRKYLRDRSELQ